MMNIVLLIIVLLSGQEMVVEGFATAEECFTEANTIIALDETILNSYMYSIECIWIEISDKVLIASFGQSI